MNTKILYSSKFWIITSVVLIIFAIILLSKKIDKTILLIDYVTVEKQTDIRAIDDSLVVPVLYSDIRLLNSLSTEIRKKRFIEIMLPAILIYRHNLNVRREHVTILQDKARHSLPWTANDSLFMSTSFEKYKTKNFNELIKRMKPPPVSLALAQAALESGWGSSRFFKEANNVFGIWSFSKNDERIIANESREGKKIFLKKYPNLLGSVEDYHLLLASSNAYSGFRDCIQRENNVFELIWYLRLYSERRDQYVIMLRNVIVASDLTKFDSYKINPEFFDYPTDDTALF